VGGSTQRPDGSATAVLQPNALAAPTTDGTLNLPAGAGRQEDSMPPRPIWKGVIAFGMVSIPVRLSKATEEHDLRFHLLHKTDNARLKQLRVCTEDGETVTLDQTVRAFEPSPGEYVVMDPEDFEKVQVESARTIDIDEFVPLESIDPIYFENSYFLEPEATGKKPFVLLRQALTEGKRVGIAHLTMSQKEYLCAVRVYRSTLMLETLRYADEVRSASEEISADEVKISDKEVQLAASLVEALSGEFEPEKYHDRYRDALLDAITKKQEGQQFEPKKLPTSRAAATDLMAALRESVEAVRKSKGTSTAAANGNSASTGQKPPASRRGKPRPEVTEEEPEVEEAPKRRVRKAS
jgi:DNA end-binding protein Ku